MTLADLQALFWHAARGQVAPETLDAAFVARPLRSGSARMRIYNGGYFSRLEGAMEDAFPAIKTLVGNERFQALARRCVIRYPSEHAALERVGARFAQMLRASAKPHERALADVAELEYARVCALLAPSDAVVKDPVVFTRHPFHTVRLHWVRSLERRWVNKQAFRAWQSPVLGDDAGGDVCTLGVAFWRSHHQVHHRSLDDLEARILLSAPESIGVLDLCGQLEDQADASLQVFQLLRRWLSQGWVAKITTDGQCTPSLNHESSEHAPPSSTDLA